MNTSENVKTAIDTFGRLSFMLETYVKLSQTGDHQDVAKSVLEKCIIDSGKLTEQLGKINSQLNLYGNVNE